MPHSSTHANSLCRRPTGQRAGTPLTALTTSIANVLHRSLTASAAADPLVREPGKTEYSAPWSLRPCFLQGETGHLHCGPRNAGGHSAGYSRNATGDLSSRDCAYLLDIRRVGRFLDFRLLSEYLYAAWECVVSVRRFELERCRPCRLAIPEHSPRGRTHPIGKEVLQTQVLEPVLSVRIEAIRTGKALAGYGCEEGEIR